MMATFNVDDVKVCEQPLPSVNSQSIPDVIGKKIHVEPESCCKLSEKLNLIKSYFSFNSFVQAVDTAYALHYPLVLSPDMIWQCVAQGFGIHVNKNAEKLRHYFVEHEGKKTIVVRVDHFTKGSRDNDWESAFGDSSEGIRKNVGDEIHDLLTPDFSTTGPVEKAASQVVLMNTFKEYFGFMSMTMCGIPSVTLEGTVEDWMKLRDKTLSLSRFDFKWTDAVKPILDEFVNAASGKVNTGFWQTMYKNHGGSGGPFISGWIVTLFPYLGYTDNPKQMRQNSYLISWNQQDDSAIFPHGVTTSMFPNGTVSTPFIWQYFSEEFEMYFYAGFLGVGQDKKTLALRPVIGWAVVDKEEEEKAKLEQRSRF